MITTNIVERIHAHVGSFPRIFSIYLLFLVVDVLLFNIFPTPLTFNNMTYIKEIFQLDDCLDWIIENGFKRVAIQLKLEDLKHSFNITSYLRERYQKLLVKSSSLDTDTQPLDLYVTQSSTCCVDLLVTQHVSNIDAIIHMGNVCLSKPEIKNQQSQLPILFAFGRRSISQDNFSLNAESIIHEIESIMQSDAGSRICLLYDTALIDYANKLEDKITEKGYNSSVHVANLHCPSSTWHTTPENQSRFIKSQGANSFGHYILQKPINYYNCAIYLGNRLSIHLSLEGPPKLLKINCYDNVDVENINVSRLLNRRIALVGRLKEDEELKFGVIITNPLPNITSCIDRLESYSKPRKHTLYFISMVQTIDECKIGNFDLCDAFIVINLCTCSTILESLVFNRPIITELEFKLACGFEGVYGRVMWPGCSSHLSEDDMINKRKVSNVSLALIHMRNELLERCSQARANKWSGLEYKASDGSGGEGVESLVLEEGLSGIASSYVSEPLKKLVDPVEEDGAAISSSTTTTTPNITTVVAGCSDVGNK